MLTGQVQASLLECPLSVGRHSGKERYSHTCQLIQNVQKAPYEFDTADLSHPYACCGGGEAVRILAFTFKINERLVH